MTFDEIFIELIEREKGFTKDPKDRGNWTSGVVGHGELKGTKYGISAMTYPELDIQNLTLDKAKSIYKKDWWDKMRLDELPTSIHYDLFDTAVNSGISRAIKLLQKTVGITEDGIIGPNTIKAVLSYNQSKLSPSFNAYRLLFMTDIPTWEQYGKGWARRIAKNILM